jgi:hypothetical protein
MLAIRKMIGERYLWVELICIVQDGGGAASEVMRMDQIYSDAYLTIISAGINGLLMPSTLARLDAQCVTGACDKGKPKQGDECCASINDQIEMHYKKLSASKWATRDWT